MSIASNKQDFLYKKNLGVVNSQGPAISYQSETAGNARPRIISNLQLFSQPIPQNAPTGTDLGPKKYVKADGTLDSSDIGLGSVQTSLTYPYIQYVDKLVLSSASKYAYYFNNPGISTNTNLLSNTVPYNYNPSNTSWAYKVTSSNYSGNVDPSLYIVDTDAGYLYFVNTTDWTPYGTPSISFYRYNGTIGIPTNLGNFAGAYSQGTGAIAYGDRAGYTGQGTNALAIGNFAGAYGQGTGSIAIGAFAGPTGLTANSIVLNASGTGLAGTGPTGGFYVAPIASYSGSTGPFNILAYGSDKQLVTIDATGFSSALGITLGGGSGGSATPYINNNNINLNTSSTTTFINTIPTNNVLNSTITATGNTIGVLNSLTSPNVFISFNGGTTFSSNLIPSSFQQKGVTTVLRCYLISMSDSFILAAIITTNSNPYAIIWSTDNGLNWTLTGSNYISTPDLCIAVNSVNFARANSNGAIYINGSICSIQPPPSPIMTNADIKISNDGSFMAFLINNNVNNYVYYTQNINNNPNFYNILPFFTPSIQINCISNIYNNNNIYTFICCDYAKLYISTYNSNGSLSYTTILYPNTFKGIFMLNNSIICAWTEKTIYYTNNGGTSWSTIIMNELVYNCSISTSYILTVILFDGIYKTDVSVGLKTSSISIGHNFSTTYSNSIALNASNSNLSTSTSGFYVAPVASHTGSMGPLTLLAYGADKQIVTVTGSALKAINVGSSSGVTGSSYKTSWVAASATGPGALVYSTMSPNGQYQIMPNNNSDGGFYYTTNGNTANPTWFFKSATVPASISRIVLISDNKNAVMMNNHYGYASDFETVNFSASANLGIGVIVAAKGSSDLSTILATTYTVSSANGYYLQLGTVSTTPNFVNITPHLTSISSSNLIINNNTTIGLSKDGNVCITALSTTTGSSLYFTSILKSTPGANPLTISSTNMNTITKTISNLSEFARAGMYLTYETINSSTCITNITGNSITVSSADNQNLTGLRIFAPLNLISPLIDYSSTNRTISEWRTVAISTGSGSTTDKHYMLVGGFNTFVYLGIYDRSLINTTTPPYVYPATPTFTKTSLPQTNWQSYTISATGQYMYALTTSGIVYYSDSYGESWTSYMGPSDTSYTSTGVLSLSDNGMYGLMTNNSVNPIYNFNTVYTNTTGNALALGTNAGQTNQGAGSVAIGNSAGQTETALSYGSFATSKWFTPVSSSSNINSVACSASGQIQLYGRDELGFYNPYISKDSGQTFSVISSSDLSTFAQNIYAISADGNTIVIVTSSSATAYISPNAGASFPIRYTCGTGNETARAVAVSGEGQYIVIITSLGVYFSNNTGKTFTNVFSGLITRASCAISYTGQYILININGAYYILNNYTILSYSIYIYLPFESISGINIDGITVTTNVGVVTNSSIKKIGTNSAAFGSNKYLVIPMDSSATSFTLCCWVYYNNLNPSTGAGVIFSLYNSGDIDTASLADVFLSGSTIYSNINKFGTIPSGNQIIGPSIAAATWYHVALTFNYNGGSNGTYIVYVNGAIVGQRTTGTLSTGYFFPNQLYMGRTSLSGNNQFIDGYVDDFRYYKSVLNASQISTIYGLTTPSALSPIYGLFTLLTTNLYLPFESISGTNIDGVVVNTNNGPVATNTSVKKIGSSSAAFNGTSNYIVTPVNYNIGSGFTMCCWVYFANKNRQFIWCLSAGYTHLYGAFIYLFLGNNDNTINLVYNGSPPPRSITYTIPSLAINTWYHFSVSFNQNGTTTLYVNGSPVGTFTATDSSFSTGNGTWAGSAFVNNYPNQVIVIGTNSWSGDTESRFFNGYIDDFRYYGSMLSASQISQIYSYNTTTTTFANTLTVSLSGQYQAYTSLGISYLSTNFGASYSGLITPTNINSLVISQNGQTLAYNDGAAIYYSSNQGASWFTINPTALTAPVSLAMSADGSYFITAGASAVYTLNTDAAGNSVAIGNSAGQINQAVNAIAIGNMAGQINQPANTIVLNASGTALNPTVTNGCFIAPIATQANSTSTFFNLLMYGSDNQVVQSNNLKMDASGSITSGSITSGSITSGSITSGSITSGSITSTISASLVDSPSYPALSLTNNSGFNSSAIDFYPHINVGSFNNIVQTGDFAIINKDQSISAGISVGTWGGTAGLRVGNSDVKINSILKLTSSSLTYNSVNIELINTNLNGRKYGIFSDFTGSLVFLDNSGTNPVSRLTITQDGNIGIGRIPSRTLDVAGDIRLTGEIISTNMNACRFVQQGSYGAFFRNDGGCLYILLTSSGDPYGGWNGLRPFYIDLANGVLYSNNAQRFSGGMTACLGNGSWYAPNNPTNWGDYAFFVGGGGGPGSPSAFNNQSSGLGIGYDNQYNPGHVRLMALQPNIQWKEMHYGAHIHVFWTFGIYLCGYVNSGGFVSLSDGRAKRDVRPIKTARSLERILRARPVTYRRITQEDDKMIPDRERLLNHIGLIAQEVREFNPHAVDDSATNEKQEYLGIRYNDFVIHLIGAVQELHKKLALTEEKLALTEEKLVSTYAKLVSTEEKLALTDAKLALTEEKLASTDAKLALTDAKLVSTEEKLASTDAKLASLQLSALEARLAAQERVNELQQEQINRLVAALPNAFNVIV
jgi:hypothetical protein